MRKYPTLSAFKSSDYLVGFVPSGADAGTWRRPDTSTEPARVRAATIESKADTDLANVTPSTGRRRFFDIAPGAGWQTTLAAAITAGVKRIAAFPGVYELSPSTGVYALSLISTSDVDIDWGGSTLRILWDPATQAYPPPTMLFQGNKNLKFRNYTVEYSPRVTSQGVITALTTSTIDLQIETGLEPVWTDMDTMAQIDANGVVLNWQYYADAQKRSNPYPIAALGGGAYRITTPDGGGTVTAVTSLNPLTFTVPNHGLSDGQRITASGIGGLQIGGVSVLSTSGLFVRVSGTSDTDDGDLNTVIICSIDTGTSIDATGATAWDGAGSIAAVRVPSWAAVGQTLMLICRKRGGNPHVIHSNVKLVFDVKLRESAAACFVGRDNTDPTFRIDSVNDGPLCCNADVVYISETRGTLYAPFFHLKGHGDDGLNTFSIFVDSRVAPTWTGNNTFRLTGAWGAVTNFRPLKPRVGDVLEFWDTNAAYKASVTVTGYDSGDANKVVLSADRPAGYTTDWKILNRSACARVKVGHFHSEAGITSCFTAQADDVDIDYLLAEGSWGEALRISMPGAGWLSVGGTKGGWRCNTFVGKNCAMRKHSTKGAVIVTRRFGMSRTLGAGHVPSDYKPVEFGKVILDGFGYGGIACQGYDIYIDTLTVRNAGLLRSTLTYPNTPGLLTRALYARGSTLRIGRVMGDPIPTSDMYALEGGRIFIGDRLVAGAGAQPRYVSGRWYAPPRTIYNAGQAATVGAIVFAMLLIDERVTIDQLGVNVATVSAGGNFQLGVYSYDRITDTLALLRSSASGSTAATGAVNVALSSSLTLEPGAYFVGIMTDNSTVVVNGAAVTNGASLAEIGVSGASDIFGVGGFKAALQLASGVTFGTWPATIASPAPNANTRAPLIQFRVA